MERERRENLPERQGGRVSFAPSSCNERIAEVSSCLQMQLLSYFVPDIQTDRQTKNFHFRSRGTALGL